MVTLLATAAASWAALMALAPLLQTRRMYQRGSSDDVSIGYLLILLPGFLLWAAYGVAIGDPYLVAPNVLAFLVVANLERIAQKPVQMIPPAAVYNNGRSWLYTLDVAQGVVFARVVLAVKFCE